MEWLLPVVVLFAVVYLIARPSRPLDNRPKTDRQARKAYGSEIKKEASAAAEVYRQLTADPLARTAANQIPGLVGRMESLIEEYGGCAYCGTELSSQNLHWDHVVPLYLGGANHVDNIVPACSSCNLAKGRKGHERFIRELGTRAGPKVVSITGRRADRKLNKEERDEAARNLTLAAGLQGREVVSAPSQVLEARQSMLIGHRQALQSLVQRWVPEIEECPNRLRTRTHFNRGGRGRPPGIYCSGKQPCAQCRRGQFRIREPREVADALRQVAKLEEEKDLHIRTRVQILDRKRMQLITVGRKWAVPYNNKTKNLLWWSTSEKAREYERNRHDLVPWSVGVGLQSE